jgi:hypothetical protein
MMEVLTIILTLSSPTLMRLTFTSLTATMNCFIPRFDLEEDAHFYYLRGEIRGAKAEDITIEPRDAIR